MHTLEQRAMQIIAHNGITGPWLTFGNRLSQDGALSTAIVQAITEARQTKTPKSREEVNRLFDRKRANLAAARSLLAELISRYDREATWHDLDQVIRQWDVSAAMGVLNSDFALHPFPAVLRSLEFNWTYMKGHSVRGFYLMTDQYLQRLEEVTAAAKRSFGEEVSSGVVEPFWLIRADLLSIETPIHCDVCKLTISCLIAARQVLAERITVVAINPTS